jgi:leucyl aminopeptidase
MKITCTEPVLGATSISFVEGDITRTVEAGNATEIRIGVGKLAEADRRKALTLIRKAVRVAREQKLSNITLDPATIPGLTGVTDEELGRIIAENTLMAQYEFTKYKSLKAGEYSGIDTLFIPNVNDAFKKGIVIGTVVGETINIGRDLANAPGGHMTPQVLADAAVALAKGTEVKVTILNKKEIEKLKMGLVLGVAQGSIEEPKFIIAEYWGAGKPEKPVVLAGKGVTFDSGGLNLKGDVHMLGMQHDMAGGAAVLAAVTIAAKLGLKKNIIALVPAVENMPSGTAIRPGDVLTSMSGITVEVLNTDAEGRLILGDTLTYAERYDPRLVIDVATLTGAVVVALGNRASAVLTQNQKLETTLRDLGEESGDYVWPLPLWKEYEADIKGTVGDIANISTAANSRAGGVIVAGMFLAQFATKYLWAHIDMASRDTSIPDDNLAKGAAGVPIRLLVRLIEQY